MAHRITIASSKGGSGKTTTALNLAVALAERGRQTLLVDLDPQGAVGLFLAKEDAEWGGLVEILAHGANADEAVVQTNLPALRIVPRGRLDPIDVCDYEQRLSRGGVVAQLLDALDNGVEYVIIDTPSGLGAVTRAALASSGWVIVPLQAEPVALRAVGQSLRVIDHVRCHENPELQLAGILPTMVQLDQESSLNVMATVWSGFGRVFETAVPRAAAFAEASAVGIPVAFLAGPKPPEARRFALLAEEVEDRVNETTGGTDDREHRRLV